MKTKYVQDDPKWKQLAKRSDDLKYVLITFGRQFSPEVLKVVQDDFHKAENAINRYERKLAKLGYWSLA